MRKQVSFSIKATNNSLLQARITKTEEDFVEQVRITKTEEDFVEQARITEEEDFVEKVYISEYSNDKDGQAKRYAILISVVL